MPAAPEASIYMKLYQVDPNKVILRDYLAKDRTMLANERTFLAFVRTAIGFAGTGVACIKLVSDQTVMIMGIAMLVISPLIFVYGLSRYLSVRKRIQAIPDNNLLQEPKEEQLYDIANQKYNLRHQS